MLCDIEVQDPPSVMTDHEEVEHAERDRWDREEVHCGDCFAMVPKECKPAFSRFRISGRASHPARDGSLGDIEAEHEKLSVNPRCAPRRVFDDHWESQLSELLREYLPASRLSYFGDQPPIQTEASAVPAHNCLRPYHNQRVLPLGPNSPGRYPKQLVEGIQSWPRTLAFEDDELLP